MVISLICTILVPVVVFAPEEFTALRVGWIVCLVYFTLELCLRFISCTHKRWFFLAPITVLDVQALIGIAVASGLFVQWSVEWLPTTLSLLRMLHVLYLFRHVRFLRCLSYTITHGLSDIFYILLLYVLLAFFFAFEVYYAEAGEDYSHMISISGALWWAFITLTTVGYGDITPVGVQSKHVGVFCSITGVFMYSLVAAAVLHRFDKYNSEVQYRRPRKPFLPYHRLKAKLPKAKTPSHV